MSLRNECFNFKKTPDVLEVKVEDKKVVERLLLNNESPIIPEVMAVALLPKYVVPTLVYEGKSILTTMWRCLIK